MPAHKMFETGKFTKSRPHSEATKEKMRKAAQARWAKQRKEKQNG